MLSDFGANHGTKHRLDLCSLELVRRQCLARLGRYDGPDLVRECHLAVTTIFTCTRAVEQALIDGLGGDSTYVRSRLITRHGVFIGQPIKIMVKFWRSFFKFSNFFFFFFFRSRCRR